jgi:hypothetical protein
MEIEGSFPESKFHYSPPSRAEVKSVWSISAIFSIRLYGVVLKSKVFLVLIKYHDMKTYWGNGCMFTSVLTSALDGSEWSGSRPGHFTPGEKAAGNHWIGGWVERGA